MKKIKINKEATMTNVKQFLKQYPHYLNLAKRCSLTNLHAVNFDNVKASNNINSVDKNMTHYLSIKERITAINDTLDKLTVPDGKKVLTLKYCLTDPLTVKEIMARLYISRRTFYKIMDQALLEFAERYPLADLIVFDDEE